MAKEDNIEVSGKVVDALPGGQFKVEIQNGSIVVCTIAGKLRLNKITIIEGDDVTIHLSPYDLSRGRIVWRGRKI